MHSPKKELLSTFTSLRYLYDNIYNDKIANIHMHNPKKNFFLFLPPQDISFTMIKLLNWVKYAQIQKRTSFFILSFSHMNYNLH